jgi:hypothetical protein
MTTADEIIAEALRKSGGCSRTRNGGDLAVAFRPCQPLQAASESAIAGRSGDV